MTNETNYRTKANAVFFAAIMVVSMVAVGFAAAPAAAAVTGITVDSAGDVTVGNGAATQDVTFSVDVEDGDTDVPVEIDLSQAADADVSPSVSGVSTTGEVSATDDGIDGNTHTVLVSDSANDDTASSGTVTVTYEHNTASLTNDDTTSNDGVTFDISDDTGNITGSVAFGLTTAVGDFTVNGVSADDEVTLFDADGNEVETQTATGTSVTFGELVDGEYTASVPGLSTDSATVTDGASTSVTLDPAEEPNRNLFYQGQELTVSGLIVGDDYELRQDVVQTEDGSSFEREINAGDNGEIVIDTSGIDNGDYFLVGTGVAKTDAIFNGQETFEVTTQDLTTEFDEDSVQADDEADLEIDSNRGTYSLNVSADGDLDDDQLIQLFEDDFDYTDDDNEDDLITLDDVSDDTFSANFSNVDDLNTGNYEFTFESTDTTAEDTASIEVTEAGEGELELSEGSYDVAQGDVSEITVELNEVTEGTVVIGNEEDDNY